MKAIDNVISRCIRIVPWFIVVGTPFYLLGLQFYFSSKGLLLSSAIAAIFGSVLFKVGKKRPQFTSPIALLAPCLFLIIFYLSYPVPLSLLYALSICGLFLGLHSVQQLEMNASRGGRSEIVLNLSSVAHAGILTAYESFFKTWSAVALCVVLLRTLLTSSFIVTFIPLTGIAVILSSVIVLPNHKESK